MEERGQFTFYRSYYQAVRGLPEEVQLHVLMAVIAYGLDGTEPVDLDPVETAMFILVRPTLDAGRKKAQRKKEKKKEKENKKEKEEENKKEKEGEKKKEKETETENEKESSLIRPAESGFEKFWDLYPVKIDKSRTWLEFVKLNDAERILQGLKKWLDCKQWTRDGGRFIPRPVKFLQEKHYLQPPKEIPQGASGQLGEAEVEAIGQMMGWPPEEGAALSS